MNTRSQRRSRWNIIKKLGLFFSTVLVIYFGVNIFRRRGQNHTSAISIKIADDKKNPKINGIAVISNNYGTFLVITDLENDRMKLLSLQHKKVVTSLNLDHLWGVTTVSADQVAVTRTLPGELTLVNVDTDKWNLDIASKFKIDGGGKGITYDGKSFYVLFEAGYIQIYDIYGKWVRTINWLREFNFGFDGLALSPDKKTIFVSNWNKLAITSMTMDGEILVKYKNDRLRYARGLVVTKMDKVFVCGYESKNVLMLSSDLKMEKVLRSQELEHGPIGIAVFDNTVYIGFWGKNNIHAYDFYSFGEPLNSTPGHCVSVYSILLLINLITLHVVI